MLHFVIAVIVIIGTIWALVVFPSFRVVALILVGLGAGAYYWSTKEAGEQQKREHDKKEQEDAEFRIKKKAFCEAEQKRWDIVAASQIEIRNTSLKQAASYSVFNDEYDVTASVKNISKSKVTALRVNVAALDCPTQDARDASCETIGRGNGEFSTDIPAGEVRQINGMVKMRDVAKPRGVFAPQLRVSGVRAALDASDENSEGGSGLLNRYIYGDCK